MGKHDQFRPERIELETPSIGGKAWVLQKAGLYVLEVGEGTCRTCAMTHAGSGSVMIYDGIPDENGFLEEAAPDDISPHGRPLLWMPQAVMGSWMLDAGFLKGLTVHAVGGHEGMAPVCTIVWMPRSKSRS